MKQGLFLIALILAAVNCQSSTGEAENILQGLYQDAQDSLKGLQDTWAVNGGLLNDNLSSWEGSFNSQTDECDQKDQVVEDTSDNQDKNNTFIAWISTTTAVSVAKYNKIYEDRCQANRNYISGLKADKTLLKLIEFLRSALQNQTTMSLAQKREIQNTMMQFLQLYATRDTKKMLSLHMKLSAVDEPEAQAGDDHVDDAAFDVDTDFEVSQNRDVGSEHIDENRDNIDLENFENGDRKNLGEHLDTMYQLLDEMETEIKLKMGESQEDEVNSGITAAEFRLHLEKEMQELDEQLYIEVQKSSQIARRLKQVQGVAVTCHIELDQVTLAYEEAQTTYTEASDKFEAKAGDAQDEIDLFEYVLTQYKKSVSGAGAEFDGRIDDYVDDGSFDDGSYDEREIDQIDTLAESQAQ